MVPSILLVHRHQWHRHQWHGHEWQSCQCTRIEPQPVVHWELSWPELAGLCGCPVEALRFSTRVRPVHLAHGGAWARLEALDSLRWPFLDAPVIHGRAVAVRPVLGSGSAHCPGQNPWGSAAPAWRALDPWEAENALWALRRYVLPLPALSCPVDQAFLRSICWPVHAAYREAKRSGDSALCSATSWRCSACGRSGPWLGAEASADRFAEDGLGRIHQKRAADQRLDDLGDGATTADREFLDAP
jgi:hypothetical protein